MASWNGREVTNEHILPYVESGSAPEDIKKALQTLPFERNIFKLMANAPNFFAAFMQLLGRCFSPDKALLPSEWQVAVLVTAVTLDAPYEFDVNAPLARLLPGFDESKMAAIKSLDFANASFTARERSIGRLVVEIAHSDRASRATMDALKAEFSAEEIIEIFTIHGIYSMLARTMNSAVIDFDPPIPGLENMLAKTFTRDIERDEKAYEKRRTSQA